ncbi:MAG: 8-hydroxy-5-deazaflavin:NADPH oxidoreductase [Gemmatimonadetes bacterium]|nr:8-hydroxy-5-deazaflavin:NADPH oxidoreductase [Gemmatimonadota bacterium]
MRLGIIGAGHVGGTLGRLFEAQGHDVRFGVRDPNAQAAGGLPRNRSGSVAEVAAFGDVIILAIPWNAAKDAIAAAGSLAGKTVIDCINPVLPDLSGLALGTTTSAAEEIARLIPEAKVVKCFNTLGHTNLANPMFGDQKASMLFAGDDAGAKLIVSELGNQLGFDMVDAGPLTQARWLEAMGILWITMALKYGGSQRSAFKLLR